jgi:large subunit ribosomal protein L33
MTADTQDGTRLAERGAKTRAKIVAAAADLMYIKGVAATTLSGVTFVGNLSSHSRYPRWQCLGLELRDKLMARSTNVRPIVMMRSTVGTGSTYVTRKSRRSDPDRLVLCKYDPILRQHVEFREAR